MNRMVILKAIREMAVTLRDANASSELEAVYDYIINACNTGIYIMDKKGWSE